MTGPSTFCIAFVASLISAGVALAEDPFENNVDARQGQFQLIAFNVGTLGAMAKGEAEYDPVIAAQAAGNLVSVSKLHQLPMWPAGSDVMSIEDTRANPSIWENTDDFIAKWQDFGVKAAELEAVAGNGKEALGPALGGLGGTCKACHEAHRAPKS